MNPQTTQSLAQRLHPWADQVEEDLRQWAVEPGVAETLVEAMRYCLSGGKRLRPALVCLSARAVGGDASGEAVRRCAAAVEMVHVYSLVHDDLPAMDDDSLRRGRPTAHVKFGEAMAILVGDALLTRALGLPAECPDGHAAELAAELARAAGPAGMVGGQVADMDLCELPEDLDGLQYIHERKTAALLRASARMGAIAADADADALEAVSRYAEKLGLAFQVYDDLLDATATSEQLGKTPGKDARTGKRTYVTLLGKDRAARLGEEITRQAVDALAPLGENAAELRELALLLSRRNR